MNSSRTAGGVPQTALISNRQQTNPCQLRGCPIPKTFRQPSNHFLPPFRDLQRKSL